MENKVITKNWDITKVSQKLNPVDLLESWRKTKLSEISLRKNAFKTKENFKKWWFVYLRAESLQVKVRIMYNEYKNNKKCTDEEKDFVDETDRINTELKTHYQKLSKIYKLIVKNKKKVLSYIASDPDLKKYKVKITLDFLNSEGHDISEEDIKARDASWGIGVLKEIYKALNEDKVYDVVRDKNGKVIKEIRCWSDGTESWDPVIRRKTFECWYSFDFDHRNTLLTLCMFMAARLNQNAEYYNYKTWIEKKVNEELLISLKDYYYIIDSCDKFSQAYLNYHTYNRNLIAKAYGLDEWNFWDSELTIKNTQTPISQKDATQLVIDGLSCFGEDYLNKVKSCFKNNIVLWSKEKRKIGPGFCISGTSQIDEHPIYFNWDGTIKSVATLAHELGHNVSSKYIKENNEVNTEQTEMFTEISSVVNSVIFNLFVIKKLKEQKVPKSQLYGMYTNLIEYLLDTICETGFYLQFADRATEKMLKEDWKPADFELYGVSLKNAYCGMTSKEYRLRRSKLPFALENLQFYRSYLDAAIKQNVDISYYVGSIIALVIAPKILAGDKQTLNRYFKFLKAGTSIDPIKTLKETLEINLLKPQVYTQAKHNLEQLVKEFKKDIKI